MIFCEDRGRHSAQRRCLYPSHSLFLATQRKRTFRRSALGFLGVGGAKVSGKQTSRLQPFEGSTKNGRWFRLTVEMLDSRAWKALSVHEQVLYVHMKCKFNGSNARDISFIHREAERLMTARTFRKSMKRLIEVGFVDVIERWPYSCRPNIYGFSDRWQGTAS